MNNACVSLTSKIDALDKLHEPFLNFDPTSDISFEEKSTVYCSLVALVKDEYPFDNALQGRAEQFLENLEPYWGDEIQATRLVTDLVPSSNGSPSGFVESIVSLLSSPNSTVVAAALSFLLQTGSSSARVKLHFVEADLITNIIATVQPHTPPILGDATIIPTLIGIIVESLSLVRPHDVMDIALEYVIASPIVMAFSSCLADTEGFNLDRNLDHIGFSLSEWKEKGAEMEKSGKQILQALFSEGFEDTLEQTMKHDKSVNYGITIVIDGHYISQMLGSNVTER
ncbi:hypothetical protein BLNAU_18339 [Blattamonas nauphoetae]|uniref:Uncharacterized protein n=1 Tax=Blattamonas nauphoetae TaxID=2049346 RepID=A0ABQ9X589_9EUKA|nr:hypothetical protein BLNAU_18339 [Blattamonas nauphoetae]